MFNFSTAIASKATNIQTRIFMAPLWIFKH